MGRRPRIYYSESQKALTWERWQKGDSLQQIAQLFDRSHSSAQGILVQTGGIRPADDLSQSLHSGSRRSKEGAAAAFAAHPSHAPFTPSHPEG